MKKFRLIPVSRNEYTIFVIQIKFLWFFWVNYMEWDEYAENWETFEYSSKEYALRKITELRAKELRKKRK